MRDFEPRRDMLLLVGTGYASSEAALAAMLSVNGGLELYWAGGGVRLEGMYPGALQPSDIMIV